MPKKPAPSRLTVAEAARAVKMTPMGIYQAIWRGALRARRVKGLVTVTRADLKAYRAAIRAAMREAKKPKRTRLTDEEFLQRLWDTDPD
jgi:hypothetical protein